jgi:hypothetical protein
VLGAPGVSAKTISRGKSVSTDKAETASDREWRQVEGSGAISMELGRILRLEHASGDARHEAAGNEPLSQDAEIVP